MLRRFAPPLTALALLFGTAALLGCDSAPEGPLPASNDPIENPPPPEPLPPGEA
ncbi:hypothetical protein [Alienimonas californiensis]|uniref:Uncharacterized protein n=1 Tax=Alienimonas californiensis TaxID=2527989 RepID=A0A517P725_9PLAN|nr:hypothetical protein [Alienimonas californiensis]QDT15177.1 hypothetical protein CA12_12580 [Alienimonas californiensis]